MRGEGDPGLSETDRELGFFPDRSDEATRLCGAGKRSWICFAALARTDEGAGFRYLLFRDWNDATEAPSTAESVRPALGSPDDGRSSATHSPAARPWCRRCPRAPIPSRRRSRVIAHFRPHRAYWLIPGAPGRSGMSRLVTVAAAVAMIGVAGAAAPGSEPSADAPMAQAEDAPREVGRSVPRPPAGAGPKQGPTPAERPGYSYEEGMPQRPCLPHNPQLGPPCVSPQR